MKKKIVLVLVVFILAFPVVCLSGEYKLLKGKKEAVCRVYLKNLNSLPNWPLMACDRKFSEKIPDLKGIEWQPDFTEKNRQRVILDKDVWRKIFTFIDPSKFPEKETDDYPGYGIRKAKIDIDNDGVLETVYRPNTYDCEASHYYAIHLVVYDENKNDIDMVRTKQILRDAIWNNLISHGVMLDVFTYRGTTYFDMWDDRGFVNDPATLTVYLFKNNQVQKECIYQHRKKN